MGQTILPPNERFPIAPAVFRRFANHRRHRLRPIILVKSYEGYVRARGVFPFASQNILRKYFHSDLHRSMEGAVQTCLQHDYFADADRVTKIDVVHRRGHRHGTAVPVRGNSRRDIYKVHDPAAQDIAEDVGVLRKHYLRHFRAGSAYRLARQILRNLIAGSLGHLSSMRPAISSREIYFQHRFSRPPRFCRAHSDFAASTMTGYNTRLRAPAQLKL
jgi:hypothetical protein